MWNHSNAFIIGRRTGIMCDPLLKNTEYTEVKFGCPGVQVNKQLYSELGDTCNRSYDFSA